MLINGVTYTATPNEIVQVIERARQNGTRIRIHYGDKNFGQDWGDIYNMAGRVGLSSGTTKVPILLANSRSTSGTAILTEHIVRIRYANRKEGGDLWRHAMYSPPAADEFTPADYKRHFA